MTDLRRYSNTVISAAALEVHSRYAYDGAARLSSITHAKSEIAAGQAWNGTSVLPASITPAQTIAAFHLSYDRDNRLTAFASYADRFRTTYSYDTTDQLTGATTAAITGLAAPSVAMPNENYRLDANGNRQTSTGVSQSASGTHNRLQTDGTFNYTYDNEGNTLTRTSIATGAVTQYVWDHRNRLTAVRERASATAVINKETIYAYDVFDRKTLDRFDSDGVGGSNRDDLWVNDGAHPLLQYRDSDGVRTAQPYRLVNRYLHGSVIDQILADEQYASGTGPVLSGSVASATAGTTLWAVADHLGSVRDLVDNNGITRQHVVYDSFGNRISEVDRNAAGSIIPSTHAAAVDTIFGYTGREWDKDTSLQYNRARWYDPATGRWLSQDPIGFAAGDANLYRYVGNGPTTHVDPSGNEGISVIHGTTPGGATSIVQTGLQAGKDGGIWLSTQGGGVAEGATVQMNYNVNISNAREISDEVIKEAQKSANAAVKGLTGEARSTAWARAKGDYLAKWACEQGDQVFKMKAPPPYQGYHYYVKPKAWKRLSPKLVSIAGEGAEQAVKALGAAQVADEALAAASAAAKAKWAGRAVTAFRIGGRVVIVVGIAASGYEIYTAQDKWKETAKQGAGLGGGAACAYAGGAIGSPGGPIGIGVGAIIGGIIGYFAGSQAGENYYQFIYEPGALLQ